MKENVKHALFVDNYILIYSILVLKNLYVKQNYNLRVLRVTRYWKEFYRELFCTDINSVMSYFIIPDFHTLYLLNVELT